MCVCALEPKDYETIKKHRIFLPIDSKIENEITFFFITLDLQIVPASKKMGLAEYRFAVHNAYMVVVLIWIYYVVGIQTDNYFTSNSQNFKSVPTTVKTYENDTVLLPCYPTGELKRGK